MGIQGLLPLLKEAQIVENIKEYAGQRLAVDAYVWLHKGAFGCAEQLVRGEKTTRFVDYAMHRVRLLKHHAIQPVIVFDGGYLPAKAGTEVLREKSRAASLARATALEAQGRTKEARDFYTKCVDVTPEMAFQLIKALRAENVDYIVAPYEADAQLCYLERQGLVDGIITEDSDLLVFGCQKVIFKLDGNGDCTSIHRSRFDRLREFPMGGWTDLQFRRMAILSGCDYLESIPGIGIKTAHRLMRRYKTVEKILQHVRLEGSLRVTETYAADFSLAELAFIHQQVFDPRTERMVPMVEMPEGGLGENEMRYVGLEHTPEVAKGIAMGDLHPMTKLHIVDQWPGYQPLKAPLKDYKPVLGQSSKTNVVAGPMDRWVVRTPETRLKVKTYLPKPIGAPASGPSRLSDLKVKTPPLSSVARGKQPERFDSVSPPDNELKISKFFGPGGMARARARECRLEEDAPHVDVVWEDGSSVVAEKLGEVHKSRSPSPAWSSAETPPKLAQMHRAITSPFGPDISSPPHAVSPPKLRPLNRQPSFQLTPSPTRPVLIPASASPTRANGEADLISSPEDTQPASRKRVREESVRSSSVDEDEIMTPGEDLMNEEEVQKEKARKVADGWRQRFALSSVTKKNSPLTPRPSFSIGTPTPASSRTPVPSRRVLANKSLNVPLISPLIMVSKTPFVETPTRAKMTGGQKIQAFRFAGT